MSLGGLVSYYDSDDSNASGDENDKAVKVEIKATETKTTAESGSRENDKTTPASKVTVLSGQISDDEDDVPMTYQVNGGAIGSDQIDEGNFLHNNLPLPKSSVETVDKVGVVLDDKLEDEVKPKESQMKDAPKPPPKRSKQPVRITIPKLQDDEDEPKQKKIKLGPSTQKSGLASLLPPPVHAVKKESNRILVPHTLKRKPPPKPDVDKTASKRPSEDTMSKKKMTAFQAMTGYESDSDDENLNSGNFFSIDDESENNTEHLELSKDLPPCLPSVAGILPDASVTSQTGTMSTLPKITVNPDAPLGFNKEHHNPYSGASVSSQPSSSNSHTDISQSLYNVPYSQIEDSNNYEDEAPVNQPPVVDDYLQDEQFLRIQGKQRRGKEDINIIEANMNDYINSSEIELTKTLTEESTHQPHRNKDNMPTGKEKRKHQITYLAFQAKEREFELKNAWAQGRATKRQTQSKYGF